MSHTKEPWEKRDNRVIDGHDGWAVACCQGAMRNNHVCNANAERVVACVNACAGLNPDGIKGMVEALERIEGEFSRLTAIYNVEPHPEGSIMQARAALAAARIGDGE